jgi:hypothetical protein
MYTVKPCRGGSILGRGAPTLVAAAQGCREVIQVMVDCLKGRGIGDHGFVSEATPIGAVLQECDSKACGEQFCLSLFSKGLGREGKDELKFVGPGKVVAVLLELVKAPFVRGGFFRTAEEKREQARGLEGCRSRRPAFDGRQLGRGGRAHSGDELETQPPQAR